MALPPPDPAACWDGEWSSIGAEGELWLLAAMLRTVDVLPRLHPWRLGDTKGSRRIIRWSGESAPAARDDLAHTAGAPAYGLLTEEARDPHLAVDAESPSGWGVSSASSLDLTVALADRLGSAFADRVADAVAPMAQPPSGAAERPTPPPRTRWAGVVTPLTGTWLPPLAILQRAARDYDDPGTRWTTESVEFNARHTVHTQDQRVAADLLAPHVMALILDRIPDRAAVTVAGDAVHVWWAHSPPMADQPGLVVRMLDAVRDLAAAFPSFVLADHPDRSSTVEVDLAAKAAAARRYREQRQYGRSTDPVLQRIYDQARATHETGDVSSSP